MKKWIKFLQNYTQKSEDGSSKEFKEGDIIQVDEDTFKALTALKIAEETEEPKNDDNLDNLVKGFQDGISDMIEKSLEATIERINKKIEDGAPITVGDSYDSGGRGFKSDDHFFKSVFAAGSASAGAGSIDVADGMELLQKAPTGQNISNDPEGGFLVPEPIANRIWSNMMDEADSILPQTLRFETAGNSMKVPRIFESSRKEGTGKRNAGIATTWLDEAGEIQGTKFTTGRMNMELHKLGAVVYATEEMLADSGQSVTRFINRLVPRAITYAVNESFIHGSGVGKPKGILKEDALIVVAKESGQAVQTIQHRNLNKLYWRNSDRNRASWYCHPDLAAQLEFIYFLDDSTNKRPVYIPSNQIVGSPFGMLYGRPVIPYEHMKWLGKEGDILFASWGDYATLTKVGGGVNTAESIHVRFLYEETAYRFTFRIDGRAMWTSPKEDLYGSTTRSPWTTLAGREASGDTSSSGL